PGNAEERIAIRRGLLDDGGRHRAACARTIVDDDALAESARHRLHVDAHVDVGAAAGAVAEHQGQRALRKVLRMPRNIRKKHRERRKNNPDEPRNGHFAGASFMPSRWIIELTLLVSLTISARISSGAVTRMPVPVAVMRLIRSGSCDAFSTAALSFATIGGGVSCGASSPNHIATIWLTRPASVSVGRSGYWLQRLSAATASARTLFSARNGAPSA